MSAAVPASGFLIARLPGFVMSAGGVELGGVRAFPLPGNPTLEVSGDTATIALDPTAPALGLGDLFLFWLTNVTTPSTIGQSQVGAGFLAVCFGIVGGGHAWWALS